MRRYRTVIAGLALAMGLVGCAGQNPGETPPAAQNQGAEAPPEASEPSGDDDAAPEPDAHDAEAAAARNALELTGPAEAEDVPDMQAVITGVEPPCPRPSPTPQRRRSRSRARNASSASTCTAR